MKKRTLFFMASILMSALPNGSGAVKNDSSEDLRAKNQKCMPKKDWETLAKLSVQAAVIKGKPVFSACQESVCRKLEGVPMPDFVREALNQFLQTKVDQTAEGVTKASVRSVLILASIPICKHLPSLTPEEMKSIQGELTQRRKEKPSKKGFSRWWQKGRHSRLTSGGQKRRKAHEGIKKILSPAEMHAYGVLKGREKDFWLAQRAEILKNRGVDPMTLQPLKKDAVPSAAAASVAAGQAKKTGPSEKTDLFTIGAPAPTPENKAKIDENTRKAQLVLEANAYKRQFPNEDWKAFHRLSVADQEEKLKELNAQRSESEALSSAGQNPTAQQKTGAQQEQGWTEWLGSWAGYVAGS